jgi:hypothetical protein
MLNCDAENNTLQISRNLRIVASLVEVSKPRTKLLKNAVGIAPG